jgi:hypothetical protein
MKVEPVEGAASYWAGYDYEKNKKPCVWMTIKADEKCPHDCSYIVQYCRTSESAEKAADKWQKKENKAVQKNKK